MLAGEMMKRNRRGRLPAVLAHAMALENRPGGGITAEDITDQVVGVKHASESPERWKD